MTDLIERAERIAATGPNISYPSGLAAEQVREVVRGLLAIVKRAPEPSGELCKRLRKLAENSAYCDMVDDADTCRQAADRIEQLEALAVAYMNAEEEEARLQMKHDRIIENETAYSQKEITASMNETCTAIANACQAAAALKGALGMEVKRG